MRACVRACVRVCLCVHVCVCVIERREMRVRVFVLALGSFQHLRSYCSKSTPIGRILQTLYPLPSHSYNIPIYIQKINDIKPSNTYKDENFHLFNSVKIFLKS